jgi:hypothetical protein
MGRCPDGRQDVGSQREMRHLLLDHADHRRFPGPHPHKLSRGQTLVGGAFERELRVQVFTHQAVLNFARLTEQIHQLLAGFHLQRRLGRRLIRHIARHRNRPTPRMPLRAFQTEVGANPPDRHARPVTLDARTAPCQTRANARDVVSSCQTLGGMLPTQSDAD